MSDWTKQGRISMRIPEAGEKFYLPLEFDGDGAHVVGSVYFGDDNSARDFQEKIRSVMGGNHLLVGCVVIERSIDEKESVTK